MTSQLFFHDRLKSPFLTVIFGILIHVLCMLCGQKMYVFLVYRFLNFKCYIKILSLSVDGLCKREKYFISTFSIHTSCTKYFLNVSQHVSLSVIQSSSLNKHFAFNISQVFFYYYFFAVFIFFLIIYIVSPNAIFERNCFYFFLFYML